MNRWWSSRGIPYGCFFPLATSGLSGVPHSLLPGLDKIWTRMTPNVIYRRILIPSAAQASRRHFYDPAGKAGAVFGGGVGGGEVPKGFDVIRKKSAEVVKLTTDRSIDHDSRIRRSSENAARSSLAS